MTHPPVPRRLVIATRESALALWQAEHVRTRLAALYSHTHVDLLGITTQGDRIIDRPLAAIGGKGLFIKELEVAMAEGRADLAVHSLKDLPMELADGFVLAAITAREDPRDAFVSNRHTSLASLPEGAVVGTSSLRREAQLRERFPSLAVKPLRGNVNTRLRKLDEGQYDAIILAAAGLKRLGFADRIADLIDPADSLPAPGQVIEVKSLFAVPFCTTQRCSKSPVRRPVMNSFPPACTVSSHTTAWFAGCCATVARISAGAPASSVRPSSRSATLGGHKARG